MEVERQILQSLLLQEVEKKMAEFISKQTKNIRKRGMNPEEVESLIWELLGEVVKLHQKIA